MVKGSARDGKPSGVYLLLLGLVFHLVYIGSVFDCYFTSPVVHGMNSYSVSGAPEAKRVVLIVGDGLRADLLFNLNPFPAIPSSPKIIAPFLRSIAESRGAFGVSHTRVPTESRPGHVAIIGGMYEDVSAVTKGWKTNPVDFDSVFNRSSSTYSFGSPDILPMFERGATPGRVKTWTYHEDEEDFTKDATALDVWVLDHLRQLLQNASSDAVLDTELRADKVVFFLHLLGLDTTGHSYRPHSKEYMHNIEVVDDIVRQTEDALHSFYGDNRTAFVFTADHGMSNIGNHGDGHPDNTRTPLIAWGAGIRPPLPDTHPTSHDAFSHPWGAPLIHLLRHDVNQADIAPLLATLIGADWPVNSVGVLPDVDWRRSGYLDFREGDGVGEGRRARAAVVNARVVLEQYRTKDALRASHTLFYKPYPELSDAFEDGLAGAAQLSHLEEFLERSEWLEARKMSGELIDEALRGLRYLQTYDWLFLRCVVTAGYLGWMAMSALVVLRLNVLTESKPSPSLLPNVLALAALAASWTVMGLQRSPWTYYVYIAFPVYFWRSVMKDVPVLGALWRNVSAGTSSMSTSFDLFVKGLVTAGAIASMVEGFNCRLVWTAGFVCIGMIWPAVATTPAFRRNNMGLLVSWAVACVVAGTFTLLPVEKHENLLQILAGGVSYVVLGLTAIGVSWFDPWRQASRKPSASFSLIAILSFEILLIMTAMFSTRGAVRSLQARQGLPPVYQIIGWISLLLASAIPFTLSCEDRRPTSRLLIYFLAFCPAFIILSISWEGLFYLTYSIVLYLWIEMEARLFTLVGPVTPAEEKGMRRLRADDIRIALFFLFFINVAFFGTGNVASLSNFYLEPVYRLVPVFNPFIMAVLLLYRVFLPYTILAATLATLNVRLHLPPFSLFLVALSLTDGMTLAMFYKVVDQGSWLEIGQTISHFVITSLLLAWSAGICVAGEWLMSGTVGNPGVPERMAKDPVGKLE